MAYLFYTKLAKHYDKIYHYVDYEKQAKFLTQLIRQYNSSSNKKVLDVACGTGTHAYLIQKDSYEAWGLDISPDILSIARQKYPNVNFLEGNMQTFKLNEKFGTIIIFFNSILYNKNKREMTIALGNFYNHLDKNGILIFDTVNKSVGINSKKGEYKYKEKDLKIVFQPQWVFNQKKNIIDLKIDFIINGQKIHDHHAMGAFSFQEQKQLAQDAGFEVLVLERHFQEIRNHNSNSKSAIFLCKKIG